jgi:hypothetical protein
LYTYNSSNLEEAWSTAKTTNAKGVIPTIPIPGIQNLSIPVAKPVEAVMPTINSTVAFKENS